MAAGLGSGGCWAGAAVSAAAQAPTKGAEGRIGSHGAVMGAANCVKSPNALFHNFFAGSFRPRTGLRMRRSQLIYRFRHSYPRRLMLQFRLWYRLTAAAPRSRPR